MDVVNNEYRRRAGKNLSGGSLSSRMVEGGDTSDKNEDEGDRGDGIMGHSDGVKGFTRQRR